MEAETQLPLRWVHFREGPEGAGVYVHIADFLYFVESRGHTAALAELVLLLTERADQDAASRPQGLTG